MSFILLVLHTVTFLYGIGFHKKLFITIRLRKPHQKYMLSLIKISQFRGEQNVILCPVDQKEKWNTFQHFARIFSKFTSFSESQKQTLWHRKSYSFSHVQPKRTKKGLLYNKIVTKSPQDLCWHAGIALSAAVVFASDRYVFVLLGSV